LSLAHAVPSVNCESGINRSRSSTKRPLGDRQNPDTEAPCDSVRLSGNLHIVTVPRERIFEIHVLCVKFRLKNVVMTNFVVPSSRAVVLKYFSYALLDFISRFSGVPFVRWITNAAIGDAFQSFALVPQCLRHG